MTAQAEMSGADGLPADRAERNRQRAEARERRAQERGALVAERSERRAAEREQAARERAALREAKCAEEANRMAALRPAAAAEGTADAPKPKRRASGALRRTGEAGIVRDTRNYRTVVDKQRMSELSGRGTSVAGLAAVFGISIEEVEAALAEAAVQDG